MQLCLFKAVLVLSSLYILVEFIYLFIYFPFGPIQTILGLLNGGFFFSFFGSLQLIIITLFSLLLPIGFHQVPNVFRNMFPISPHLYPICFGQSWTFIIYFGGPKRSTSLLSILWSAQCFKKIGDGPIKVTHSKKQFKKQTHFGCHPFTN
jgi:hypothetical protein